MDKSKKKIMDKEQFKETVTEKKAKKLSSKTKKKRQRQYNIFPNTSITQSKKGYPITVYATLHGSPVRLGITAAYEDWKKLYEHIPNRKKDFPFDFLGSFVIPALEESLERLSLPQTGPHGSQLDYYNKKNSQSFADHMMIQSALLYNHFQSTMKKKKRDDRIDEVAKVVQMVFYDYYKGYKIKLPSDSSNYWLKCIYPGLKLLRSKSPEALDKVHYLWGFHNYLDSDQRIKKEYQDDWNLLRSLTSEYLSQHSFLFKTTA